jgi:hypothetical protein
MTTMRCLIAALVFALLACDDSGEPDPGAPDAHPGCHWDCFGYHECADGVVTTWDHRPVPCAEWRGDCPHEVSYTCEEGCGVDRLDEPFSPPELVCAENRTKKDAGAVDSGL